MRRLSATLLCSLLSAAWLAAPALAGPRVPDALRERARSEGSVRVLVRVADEADARKPRRRSARRARAEAQAQLLRELGRVPRRERRFREIPFVALELSPDALDALERSDVALAVEEDRLMAPALPESRPLIEADVAELNGFDGSGRTVAVLDTGVDTGHPFVSSAVVEEACFSGKASCPDGSVEQVGPGSAVNCDYADGCFHGTHVAGIVLGSAGSLKGVAPGASLIAIQVFSEFTGAPCNGAGENPCALAYTSDIIAGLEHVLALSLTLAVDAANLSLGGGAWTSQATCDAQNGAMKAAIDALRAAGIASVVSSGNSGRNDATASPACISSAVSVGATNDLDNVASFSNSASFLSLLAPGVSIASAVPPAIFGFDYGVASGTSMAAPQVSGSWALLRQAVPTAGVTDVLTALQGTGVPVTDPDNGITTPRIRVWQALGQLQSASPCTGPDSDGDGVPDACDNCVDVANPAQADTNGDGYGNHCDMDFNDDMNVGLWDFNHLRSRFGLSCGDAGYDADVDADSDCTIGVDDFNNFRSSWGQLPGPSGVMP